jgi:hypothetical protein
MRLAFVALLLVGIIGSSCEKHRLKQPAYLGFGWNFFEQESGDHKPVVTGGFFYLSQFNVSGTRQEGPPVDIAQALPLVKTSFSASGDLGLSMDIPVGDYTQFQVDLTVTDESNPCLVLTGNFDTGESTVPFRVEWGADKLLSFTSDVPFSLSKKEDYKVTIGINTQMLFSGISTQDWMSAPTTLEPNVGMMIIIRENQNQKLFDEIEEKLKDALVIKVSE